MNGKKEFKRSIMNGGIFCKKLGLHTNEEELVANLRKKPL